MSQEVFQLKSPENAPKKAFPRQKVVKIQYIIWIKNVSPIEEEFAHITL